ncbi:MAG TPA: hypothetical protein VHZ06_04955 [Marmoricola sp.]|nr:hypothetical protein [Marmoricola sp.]
MADPAFFATLIPPWLPAHHLVIVVSGIVELACATGMLLGRTRRGAGLVSAVLLVVIFPGNIEMAVHEIRSGGTVVIVLSLLRLPLQAPLIRAALRARR